MSKIFLSCTIVCLFVCFFYFDGFFHVALSTKQFTSEKDINQFLNVYESSVFHQSLVDQYIQDIRK